jgi:hypothetical protein
MAASSVGSIKKHFRKMADPRVVGRTEHRLVDILVIAILSAGAQNRPPRRGRPSGPKGTET